mgnify:CR=1 FL=1
MREFFVILKYSFLNSFAINKLKKKNNPTKFSFWKVFLLVFLILFSFSIVFINSLYNAQVLGLEYLEVYLSLGIFITIIFIFLTSIPNALNYLFKAKDFDFLMSLPVKTDFVLFTKVAFLLVINYILEFYFFVPILLAYAIYKKTTFLFWIFTLITFILIPLLPVTISIIISYGISLLSPKLKFKNLFTILFTFALMGIIFFVSFSSTYLSENPDEFTQKVSLFLKKTGEIAYKGIKGDLLSFCILIIISIIPFVAIIKGLSKYYLKLNNNLSQSPSGKKYSVKNIKATNQQLTLIKKEIKRYFGTPIYVVNTIVSPIFSTVFLLMFKFVMIPTFEESGFYINTYSFFGPIIVGLVLLAASANYITAPSISLEGKQFWIIRSAPVDTKQIFNAKVFLNIIVTLPFLILDAILAVIFFNIGVIDVLMLILIPFIMVIFMGYLGLFINLFFPRFDYDNEVKVIKQSLSVSLTMLIGFLVDIIIFFLCIIIHIALNNTLITYLFALIISSVLLVSMVILTYTIGVKRYLKLEV